ncbi:MAG: TonB-dependent receptor [bacterium]|nr:TonB-dependent receptor [bacterium]
MNRNLSLHHFFVFLLLISPASKIIYAADAELNEIIVYGQRPEYATVTVSELSSQELKKGAYPSVAEALDTLTGVDSRSVNKNEKQVSIRGFSQNGIKVLINGVPAYEGYFGSLDLGSLPVESVEKIVVTKGASSLLYGANTMGGVVNIITKKGSSPAKISFSAAAGNDNTQDYSLNYSAGFKKLNYYIGMDRRTSDGIRLSGKFDKDDPLMGKDSSYRENGGTRELSDYQRHSLHANLGFIPDDDTKLSLFFDYFNNKRGCPVFSDRYWRFTDWRQWQVHLAAEKRISSLLKVTGRTFYVDHYDELEDVSEEWDLTTVQSWFDRSQYLDFSAGAGLSTDISLSGWLIRSGLTYQKDRHKEKEYNSKNKNGKIIHQGWSDEQTYEADSLTSGVENYVILMERLTGYLGCGYDHFYPVRSAGQPAPADTGALNPQAGLSFTMAPGTELFSSIGKKIRFPRMKELYSQRAGGNPDLRPENTIAFEIGLKQKFLSGTAFLSFFNNEVSDLIQSTRDSGNNSVYLNIGKARLYGTEAGINSRIIKRIGARLDYTYLYTWDRVNKKELDQQPRHKAGLSLSYNFPFGLFLAGQYRYTGEQRSSGRLVPEYHLLDIKLTQSFSVTRPLRTEIFLAINNIMDINYEEGNGPQAGRSLLSGLTMAF